MELAVNGLAAQFSTFNLGAKLKAFTGLF